MVYNLFPDFQDVNSWRRRGRILLFGVFKNKDSKDIKNQLQKQGCGTVIATGFAFQNNFTFASECTQLEI